MFERFSDDARAVIIDAQVEARALRHNYIGTEHLLLGLLADPDRPVARLLADDGVDSAAARQCLATILPFGEEDVPGQIPFTPRAKKALELALRESLGAAGDVVAPEHLLLGLLREGDGVAVQILTRLGARPDRLRAATLQLLPPPGAVVREARRRARPAPRADAGFVVDPSPDVRRLLMSAGARALDDGRTQIEIADVEEALRRRGGSEEPPEASTA